MAPVESNCDSVDVGLARLVLVGVVVILVLAALDVLFGSLLSGSTPPANRMVITELASNILVFGLLVLVGMLVVVQLPALVGLIPGKRTFPWLLFGLTLIVTMGPMKNFIYRLAVVRSLPALGELGRVYIDVPIIALTGMCCLWLGSRLLNAWDRTSLALRFTLALPGLLGVVLVGFLVCRNWGEHEIAVSVIAVGLGLALFAIISAWTALRARRHAMLLVLHNSVAVSLIIWGGVLTFAQAKTVEASDYTVAAEPPIKYVILLTADSMRADSLSAYAPDSAPETPNLAGLWQQSTVFANSISPAPWTLPAFASIMTGVSPTVHQATRTNSRVPDFPRLAQRMAEAGYFTGAIALNPILRKKSNMHIGFNHYDIYPKALGQSFGAKMIFRGLPEEYCPTYATTTSLTDLAIDWISDNEEAPFFLWLHYFDPHMPLEPPAEYWPDGPPPSHIGWKFHNSEGIRSGYVRPTVEDVAWLRKLYDAEVRYVDANIGRLLGHLKNLGIYDETLIVFTSDHGEEFLEHGGIEHGHSVYEEVLRVPLIVKLPEQQESRRIEHPVSTQSIMATILSVCEIPYNESLVSPSLATLWGSDPQVFEGGPILSTGCAYYEEKTAVRFGDMKFIQRSLSGQEELYNLAQDPGERASLVTAEPKLAVEAQSLLDKYLLQSRDLWICLGEQNAEEAEIDEATLDQLKSLGYVQ